MPRCTCMTFAIVYNFCLQFQKYILVVHELLTNSPTVDFSLKSDLFWAHVNTGAANSLSLFRASILYDHKWPCNGRNFAIGGTSHPEGREVRVGGVTFWACRINGGGGNFLKYPLPGRGKFFICLNCLKITDPPEQSLNRFKLLGFNWLHYLDSFVVPSLPRRRF